MNKEPRNIVVIVTLDGEKIPVEFSQEEYSAIEEAASAEGYSVAGVAEEAAREGAYEHMARQRIIEVPSGEFQPS